MFDVSLSWSWLTLVAMGSFHGLNPAMGWLFAAALGIQEGRAGAVVNALWPIAIGHAAAIAVVVGAIAMLGEIFPSDLLTIAGGLAMLGFAAYKVISRFRHPAWVGMRVRAPDLIAWSFMMATAHGAGLMLVPVLLEIRNEESIPSAVAHEGHHAHHMRVASESGADLAASLAALGVHTIAMLVVAGLLAVVVYTRVGVDVLRRAWINMDLIWIGAMAVAGVVTVGTGCWSIVAG